MKFHVIEEKDFLNIKDPILLLKKWLQKAYKMKISKPNAMILSTSDLKGRVSARTVLLKTIEAQGLVFYTNYESLKGRHLSQNPYASVLFYWKTLGCQIHITGRVRKVSKRQSEAYWKTRSRTSQISQWVSLQSRPVEDGKTLEALYKKAAQSFEGNSIPRPGSWGGYLFSPKTFELWLEHPDRLHHRFFYRKKKKNSWICQRLFP